MPPVCDELSPGSSLPDDCTESKLEVNRYCNSSCDYSSTTYYCDPSRCGTSEVYGGQTYYCIYDNGWKWSTSKPSDFCCSDSDCPNYDSNTGLKVYCNTSTYRCQPLPECNSPSDCAPARCCDTITGARDCKMKETILSYGGKSYLCDPPEGIIEAKDEAENSTKIKSLQ